MPKLFTVFCLLLATCDAQQFKKDFFRKTPPADRLETMRQYSLEDQYKIYRYGHDKIEPPALILARPIAERGKAAVPFLIEQLKSDKNDLAVRDILYLLERMLDMKTFDARTDTGLMKLLDDRVVAIKKQNVEYSSRDTLEYIRNNPAKSTIPNPN